MAKLRFKLFPIIFLFMVVCNFSLFAEKRKVTVAFVPIEGMQIINENGEPHGYMCEYFNQIALRAQWDLEFIPMTWTEALSSLQTGEIDFSGMIPKVSYLQETLYYSKNHTGVSDSSIFIRSDDDRFFYNDPITINKKTIGLIRGGLIEQELDDYCKKNGITINKKYYFANKDILRALANKEIDAGANVTYQNEPNTKIIHHFESEHLYICTSKKNTELINELEKAYENLLLFHPDYNSLLHSYYFVGDSQKQIVLTRKEQEFINNNPSINAVYREY
ncbi:MAG: amino acid ABC transporter substrate-binding protein, partial [Spirochaetaceae bacterium]|nr:amino acid ABC transporter substrate-binding protein [Spirochaetaceae bacterium]